jgi:tRNA A37 threonylcarbamoyladenosine modification protein TsaB
MILFFDNTQKEDIQIYLLDEFGNLSKQWNKSSSTTSETLRFLTKKIKAENIHKMIVVRGPGMFSRVRSAVAMTNALAFSLNIRLVGIKKQEKPYNFTRIVKDKGEKMIEPFYGKKANITKPKLKKIQYVS